VIANGIPWRDDPNALVIGPTGVALASNGTLYLADTLDNRIAAIPQALTRTTPAADGGTTVSVGGKLIQPLGLTLAPNGDILTANAGNGNIVETTPAGKQLIARTADKKTGAGSLFGLVVNPAGTGIYFVDDGDNTLKLLHFDCRLRAFELVDDAGLGDLEREAVRAELLAVEQLGNERGKLGGEQVADADVDRHPERPPVGMPRGAIAQRGRENPARELAHQPRLDRQRQEPRRRDQPVLGVLPAHERLDRRDPVVAEIELGLVVQQQLAGVDRGAELVRQAQPGRAAVELAP
jgi:hypothetical protein